MVTYPKERNPACEMLMKEVITPSLSTLQFLITGKAHQQLKHLKKHAWSKSVSIQNMGDGNFMPFSAFYLDADLMSFYVQQCYNYDIWNSNDVAEPYPTQSYSLTDIANRLHHGKSILPTFGVLALVMKPYNLEEKNFYEYLEHNQKTQFMKLSPQQRIDLTVKTINDLILEPGRITDITLEEVKERFNLPEVKRHAREIFNRDIMKEATHLAIGYTLMHWQAYVTLLGSENENTILGRVVSLGLEIMEREQIMRLTNACSALFKMCPVAIKLDSKPPADIPSMMQNILEVKEKAEKTKEGSIWKQLPVEWSKGVKLDHEVPDISLGKDQIVKIFQDRIGCIVFACSIKFYPVDQRELVLYKYWQTVHYLVPCFIASYIKISSRNNLKDEKNYISFLHALIKQFEMKYDEWLKDLMPVVEKTIPDGTLKCHREEVEELKYKALSIDEQIRMMLGFYVNSQDVSERECIPGYDMLRDALIHWPHVYLQSDSTSYQDMYSALVTWMEVSTDILTIIHTACVEAFKPPVPGVTLFKNEALSEMYYTECVISKLILIFRVSKMYVNIEKMHKILTAVKNSILERENWKHTLYKLAFNPEMWSRTQINTYVNDNRRYLSELYYNLKKYRTSIGEIKGITWELLGDEGDYISKELITYLSNKFDEERCTKLFSLELESVRKPPKVLKKCRNCSKSESRRNKLLVCDQCVKDKYPDVHHFCCKMCQDEYWKKEHMAEHLEFDLGLADFSHLNIDKDE